MQRDDAMEMARQAGIRLDKHNGGFVDASELKRLVKLVEDKTRKELREEIIYTWVPPNFVDLAVKEEREACAKVCDDIGMSHKVSQGSDLCFDLAKSIRARGEA